MALGADYLATGHYCQIEDSASGKKLIKGKDQNKDQTYFLSAINGYVLDKVLFPIGHLDKSEVREVANRYDLSTADKKDSTGICFIGERKFRPFLSQFLAPKKGTFVEFDSKKVVGEHEGAHFYTSGQRKGLGLGGEGKPWFVVDKSMDSNEVYVVRGEEHPALYVNECSVKEINQINTDLLKGADTFNCQVKLRYRQKGVDCEVTHHDGKLKVKFPLSQRAVTVGQMAVFYVGDQCLGGGFIDSLGPSCFDLDTPPRLV